MSEAILCYWLTIKSIVSPICNWAAMQAFLVGTMHVLVTLATAPLACLPILCIACCLPPVQQIDHQDSVAIQNLLGIVFIISLIVWAFSVVFFWCQYNEIRAKRQQE